MFKIFVSSLFMVSQVHIRPLSAGPDQNFCLRYSLCNLLLNKLCMYDAFNVCCQLYKLFFAIELSSDKWEEPLSSFLFSGGYY